MRKNFELTKYPREKILDPRNTTMAQDPPDPLNLAHP